ncbi:MAG: hypothetical protein F6K39_19395 [Okeania sp. SIO3B3]|nr:hypothetical protein [Okeania sp. SIO3B3]
MLITLGDQQMLFFLSPVSSLVDSLSQEETLTKAYLGLSEAMTEPITNSVGEFVFYYNRFLGYIIYNLESTIAEIEANANATATTSIEELETLPMPEVKSASSEQKSEILVVEEAQASSTPQPPEAVNTEAKAEGIAANTFAGVAPSPKLQPGSKAGSKIGLTDLEPGDALQPGDLVRVTTADSIASGKSVEVHYVRSDGAVKSSWDGKTIYIPKNGYELEVKNIQSLQKKA